MPTPPGDLLPSTRRSLAHALAVAQATGRAPSIVGGVGRGGGLAWSGSRGTVGGAEPTADTQYRIGSITKTFIAVLVLRLRDEGRVDLADPVGRHVPGLPAPAGEVTVAALLSHTAGIAAETPPPWWERVDGSIRPDLADVLPPTPRVHPPGRRHHYSNPGYALLAGLVEHLRGAAWYDVLRREVLTPLGLDRTTAAPVPPHADGYAVHPWADLLLPEPAHDAGRMAPAGQLWSTLADLAGWAQVLLGHRPEVLHPDTARQMRTPTSPPTGAEWEGGHGLGLQLTRSGGRLLAGHTGSMPGFVAALWVDPTEELAAMAMANATSGVPVGAVAASLLSTVATAEPALPDPWEPLTELAPALLDVVGVWFWGAAPLALRLRPGQALDLTPLLGTGRASGFRAAGPDAWTGTDGYYAGETLRVQRAPGGTITHLDLASFVLTRAPYDAAAPIPGGVDPGGWQPAPR